MMRLEKTMQITSMEVGIVLLSFEVVWRDPMRSIAQTTGSRQPQYKKMSCYLGNLKGWERMNGVRSIDAARIDPGYLLRGKYEGRGMSGQTEGLPCSCNARCLQRPAVQVGLSPFATAFQYCDGETDKY